MLTIKPTWQKPLHDDPNNECRRLIYTKPPPPIPQSKENIPLMPPTSFQTSANKSIEQLDDRVYKRRKISFKIKATQTLSQNRRQTTLSANKVAQLTQRFNQLRHDEPKIARAVRRANSTRLKEPDTKRPSIKPKPVKVDNVADGKRKRVSVRRKCSVKKPVEQQAHAQAADQVDAPARHKKAVSPGSVKAAIEIFERRKSESLDHNAKAKYARTNSQELKPNEQLVNTINKVLLSTQEVVKQPPVVLKQNQTETINYSVQKRIKNEDELSKTNLTELQHYFQKQLNKKPTSTSSRTSSITSNSHATLVNLQLDPHLEPTSSANVEPNVEACSQLLDTTGLSSQTIEDIVLEVKHIPIAINNRISVTFGDETKAPKLFKSKGGLYEGLKLTKTVPPSQTLKMTVAEERLTTIVESRRPNSSFLWRSKSKEGSLNTLSCISFAEELELQFQDTGQENQESADLYDHIEPSSPQNPDNFDELYDTVEAPLKKEEESLDEGIEKYEKILEKTDAILKQYKNPQNLSFISQKNLTEEIEWQDNHSVHSYESFYNSNYEEMSLDYEYPKCVIKRSESNVSEGIYETLSLKSSLINENTTESESNLLHKPSKYPDKPLPDLPPLNLDLNTLRIPQIELELPEEEIYCTVKDYESVYNIGAPVQAANVTLCNRYLTQDTTSDLSSSGSTRDSLISCDQQSNSLYGRYGVGGGSSEVPSSSSDEWVDVSDPEFDEQCEPGFVIVHEGRKQRKNAGWSLKVRDQRRHNPKHGVRQDDASSDHYNHYYESLNSDEDFDSFDSESDDDSFTKVNQNDSGVDMGNFQLPEPPGSSGNIYGLTRLAASAGKHMKRLRRNWSLTKNDITKSLSRMTKKKSSTSLSVAPVLEQSSPKPVLREQPPPVPPPWRPAPPPPNTRPPITETPEPKSYQNVEYKSVHLNNSLSRKSNWLKFRRCVSMTNEQPAAVDLDATLDNNLNLTKSTFYLTSEINADTGEVTQPVVPIRRRNNKTPSTLGLRPQSPPPPAPITPTTPTDDKKPLNKKSQQRSTSWYAECGLFKPGGNPVPLIVPPPIPLAPPPLPQRDKNSSTCWYAEVGLYRKKNSVATSPSSSAGNSSAGGDSAAATDVYYNLRNEEQLEEEENSIYYNEERLKRCQSGDVQLLLKDEPLYQFYDAAVAESACQETSSDSDYDGYEEIGRLAPKSTPPPTPLRSRWGPGSTCRTLWCEIPEVLQSEILSTLTQTQRKLQEAKFELLTSEASYFNSLTLLEDHFISNLDLEALLPVEDRLVLFGLIEEVKRCSESMLSELEGCWQVSILLPGVMDVVLKHSSNLDVYVRYCENQVHLEAVLRRCKEKRQFGDVLKGLESNPTCQALSLYSFLMLPMQRITRMPLLVDAILKRLTANDDEFEVCQQVMMKLNEIVMRCNEGARKAERETELLKIARQLEYPPHVAAVDLSPSSQRWLVRSGELTHLVSRNDEVKLTFGKKFTKIPLTLFLFKDVLIVSRRKNDDSYTVVHHCPRNFVELSTSGANEVPGLPLKDAQSRNLLFLTLLENQEARTVEMMLSCASETDRQRWIEALSPPVSDNPYETVYESWDCPQVRAVHRYQAGQPDELNLAKGDVVNVNKKMADGWYHGERIRDGESGWFPGNHTTEIANPHVRARNLKQRYRLLAFTDSYLNKK